MQVLGIIKPNTSYSFVNMGLEGMAMDGQADKDLVGFVSEERGSVYPHPAGGDFQKWRLEGGEGGVFLIVHIQSGFKLMENAGGMECYLNAFPAGYAAEDNHHKWTFVPIHGEEGDFKIKNVGTGHVLTALGPDPGQRLFGEHGRICFHDETAPAEYQNNQKWKVGFAEQVAWVKYLREPIDYGSPQEPATTEQVLQEFTYDNDGAATISTKAEFKGKRTCNYEWHLNETWHLGGKMHAEASIPFGGAATADVDAEFNLESKQSAKVVKEIEYQHTTQITVKPHNCVIYSGVLSWASDISVNFTMKLRATGSIDGNPLTGEEAQACLKQQGPNLVVEERRGTEIYLTINGVFKGAYGIRAAHKTRDCS